MRIGNKYNQTPEWLTRHDSHGGLYISNIHTLVYHEKGCNDSFKIKKEHKVQTNNDKGLYRPCKHYKPYANLYQTILQETVEGIEHI